MWKNNIAAQSANLSAATIISLVKILNYCGVPKAIPEKVEHLSHCKTTL
jgi:hypothetical protein